MAADSDPVLASAAKFRRREEKLMKSMAEVERELAKIRAEGSVACQRLERADEIKAKREEIAKAESKARQTHPDEDVARVIRLRRELKALTPQSATASESESQPLQFCAVDGRYFENNRCPVDATHKSTGDPRQGMRESMRRLETANRPSWAPAPRDYDPDHEPRRYSTGH